MSSGKVDVAKQTLSRERVLEAGLGLADEIGIEAFTIRKLAAELDVGAMSIYHHVPSKDEIVDGMVDLVFAEIALPPEDQPWAEAIRARCRSAREVLVRHPWAAPLMESRMRPGPANLRHHDAVIGCLRRGGLSWELTGRAYAILDAFVYGFSFQAASLPAGDAEGFADVAAAMPAFDDHPHLAALTAEHVLQPGYDFGDSFEFGLDLILDGLQRAASAEA